MSMVNSLIYQNAEKSECREIRIARIQITEYNGIVLTSLTS